MPVAVVGIKYFFLLRVKHNLGYAQYVCIVISVFLFGVCVHERRRERERKRERECVCVCVCECVCVCVCVALLFHIHICFCVALTLHIFCHLQVGWISCQGKMIVHTQKVTAKKLKKLVCFKMIEKLLSQISICYTEFPVHMQFSSILNCGACLFQFPVHMQFSSSLNCGACLFQFPVVKLGSFVWGSSLKF